MRRSMPATAWRTAPKVSVWPVAMPISIAGERRG
jgi:hypothetical protein